MNWLVAVLIGHLLNAVSFVLNKVLLTKEIQNTFAFAFWIGILGLLAVVLIPFGFDIPSTAGIILNLVTGALFIAALLFFFFALKGGEASRVAPFIGGIIPILTWIFEILFLDVSLTGGPLFAFFILVIGTIIITVDIDNSDGHKEKQGAKAWAYGFFAALAFALSFGLAKIAYLDQEFFSSFVWQRFGSLLFVLLFLFSASNRKAIAESVSLFKEKAGWVYITSQAFGGVAFLFINYAISLASVSIVNALQGVQYALLLVMAVVGSIFYPKLLQESMSKKSLAVKILGVIVIGIGLYMVSQTVTYA